MAVAKLLIANGADPSPTNNDGMTAADRAERLSMFEVAAMLRRASTPAARAAVERFQSMASILLDAYRTGTSQAMERLWAHTWHRRSWEAMRRYVQLDLGRPPKTEGEDVPISLDDARWLIARDNGFTTWADLIEHAVDHAADSHPKAAAPFQRAGEAERGAATVARADTRLGCGRRDDPKPRPARARRERPDDRRDPRARRSPRARHRLASRRIEESYRRRRRPSRSA